MSSVVTKFLNAVSTFAKDRRGSTSVLFGATLLPALALVGAAIDYSRALDARSALQSAVDAAALAAADKFEPGESSRKANGEQIFAANLAATTHKISATPNVSFGEETATVTASASVETVMLGIMHMDKIDVSVTSTALNAPEMGPACVLALEPAADEAIGLDGTAELEANGCVVHSNSRSNYSLTANGSTRAHADAFCTVGKHSGTGFTEDPIHNCGVVANPFENLEQPLTGGCDFNNRRYNHGNHTIVPGIYCGGIFINAHANVRMLPGLYIIKDGPLTMNANASLQGEDVSLFLTGEGAVLNVMSNSNVDIAAPNFGPYAGFAIMQDIESDFDETTTIEGGGAIRIVGTIYLPQQTLKTGGEGDIGDHSAYMPIIARDVKFHGNARVIINVDGGAHGYPTNLPSVRSGTPRLVS